MQTIIKRASLSWLELLAALSGLIELLLLLLDWLHWRNLGSLMVANCCWSFLLTWSLGIVWGVSCLLLTLWWLSSLVVLSSSLLVLSIMLLWLNLNVNSLRNVSHLWLLEALLNLNTRAE
jgi:hypothetical protein